MADEETKEPQGADESPAEPEAPATADEAATTAEEPATAMARVEDRILARRTRVQSGEQRELTRRSVLRAGFFGGLGLTTAVGAVAFWNLMWPRGLTGFGGVINVPAERVPAPGADPVRVLEGKFWLVNLEAGAGGFGDFGAPSETGGILALWQRCPHLGCTVPWRGTFQFEGVEGWFRCPCHGSTYTAAGIRVFGPAPRPLDTMAVSVRSDGSVDVDTGAITNGDVDNAQRAVPYNA